MFDFIIKLIPYNFKKTIIDAKLKDLEKKRKLSESIPKFDLKEYHISNLKVQLNRIEMIDLLPKNAIIAEIGVDKGEFSQCIIDKAKPRKLHLIDVWDTERYDSAKKELVYEKYKKHIEKGIVEINLGYSTEVLEKFDDHYFDWVYIDTDHSYSTTKKELEVASRKVKINGIICGHDYFIGNWVKMYKYGVIEAVHEFCVTNNWEIVFLTIEQSIPPSFAIRRIQ
ncbi:class I SAM-dependent methyltransferase [Urechidicola vernalis]|uniref:Class I SAM-dependent methyltransferase n=1 Tax=Urechidicola vernalis TaxID=3075600 RepID=A0ABU2Y250_9FLAO|nr:class I SAM-dependent methyltransferase [Urechidicola sp. P050]MDT0552274.1 class I SAM-dependent methyltransferase [Urechidicola sp. P050]